MENQQEETVDEEVQRYMARFAELKGAPPDQEAQDLIRRIIETRRKDGPYWFAMWRQKVKDQFEFAGDRRESLCHLHDEKVVARIQAALKRKHGEQKAYDIAFHLSDWIGEAAFLVALHLYPERFTHKEIRQGVEAVVIHAPNHLAAAAQLHGYPVDDIFELGIRVPREDD